MKKALTVVSLLAGAVTAYSQGQVYIGDYFNTDFQVTVWSPQLDGSTTLTGNSPSSFGNGSTTGGDIPAGTQTGYTGVPLGGSATGATAPNDYANGTLWSVELYAAPGAGADPSTLTGVSGTTSTMYTSSPGQAGLWTGTQTATISGVAVSGQATLQIRAWYNGGGTFTTYESALAAAMPAGQSTTGSEALGGNQITPPDLPGPGNPGVTGGITSFSVAGVPEPSTIALGLVGASAFLMRLRKKQ
jgi:hypothetical protein